MIPKPDHGRAAGPGGTVTGDAGDTGHASATASDRGSAPLADVPALPRRLVLDTNVCLDLFVFRDPRWAALLSALRESRVQAYTRADCRMEWMLVLAYTRLGLDASQQAAALAEFDQWIALVPETAATDAIKLPACRDTDDQKFIELAAACGADALVTKDKLVLKLARKMRKLALFRILSPEQWTAEWAAASGTRAH